MQLKQCANKLEVKQACWRIARQFPVPPDCPPAPPAPPALPAGKLPFLGIRSPQFAASVPASLSYKLLIMGIFNHWYTKVTRH